MSGAGNYSLGRLKGLDLARYILHILKGTENFDVNLVVKEFDNDENFVKSILNFLKEMEWITEDQNGRYSLTSVGHTNCLDDLRF